MSQELRRFSHPVQASVIPAEVGQQMSIKHPNQMTTICYLWCCCCCEDQMYCTSSTKQTHRFLWKVNKPIVFFFCLFFVSTSQVTLGRRFLVGRRMSTNKRRGSSYVDVNVCSVQNTSKQLVALP